MVNVGWIVQNASVAATASDVFSRFSNESQTVQ